MSILVCLIGLCLSGLMAQAASVSVLDAIRVSDFEDYSHIVIETTQGNELGTCTVKPFTGRVPYVEVRMRDVSMGKLDTYQTVKSNMVNNISLSQDPTGRWLIAKIPVSSAVNLKDLHFHIWKDFVTIDLPLTVRNTKPFPSIDQIKAFKNKGGKVVILDPGHGGFHSGTTGGRYSQNPKIEEKTVVLDMAFRIKKLFDKNPMFMCILTRTDDYMPVPFGVEGSSHQSYINESLKYRVELAKQYLGNIYVSLHLNAAVSNQRDVRGYEIFYMGDESADNLFNNADIAQLEAVGVDKSNDDSYFVSLLKKELVPQNSKLLAHAITDQIQTVSGMYFRPKTIVSEKSLRVIKQFNMPSVLVEYLFLTHPQDHEFIRSSKNRDKLSQATYDGIREYFNLSGKSTQPSLELANDLEDNLEQNGLIAKEPVPNRLAGTLRDLEKNRSVTHSVTQVSAEAVPGEKSLSQNPRGARKTHIPATDEDAATGILTNAYEATPPPTVDDDPLVVLDPDSLDKPVNAVVQQSLKRAKTDIATLHMTEQPPLPLATIPDLGARAVEKAIEAEAVETPATPPSLKEHKIKKGDTLSSIALNYGITMDQLRDLNPQLGRRGSVIQLGDTLVVNLQDSKTQAISESPAQKSTKTTPKTTPKIPESNMITYTVKKHDTLELIATRYNTTPSAIMKRNKITKSLIFPGDKLQVESNAKTDQPDTKIAAAEPVEYVVKSGDTLGAIADKNGVSLKSLKQFNGISSNRIDTGQVLKIPVN